MIILIFAGLTAISYYKTDIIKKIARNYPVTYTVSEEEARVKATNLLNTIGKKEEILKVTKLNYYGINAKLRYSEDANSYIPMFKPWPAWQLFTKNYIITIQGQTSQTLGFGVNLEYLQKYVTGKIKLDSGALRKKPKNTCS